MLLTTHKPGSYDVALLLLLLTEGGPLANFSLLISRVGCAPNLLTGPSTTVPLFPGSMGYVSSLLGPAGVGLTLSTSFAPALDELPLTSLNGAHALAGLLASAGV